MKNHPYSWKADKM